MIRVAFDSQIFAQQVHGGVSRYFCQLVEHIDKSEDIRPLIVAPMHVNGYLPKIPGRLWQGFANRHQLLPKLARRILYRGAEELIMRAFRPQIIHETYYWLNPRGPAGACRVLTIYDMIHEKFGAQYHQLRGDILERKLAAVRRADHIIFISNSTRRDALEYFDLNPAKTSVIHLGFDLKANVGRHESAASPGSRPYVLYVGLREGYKNFENFAKAFGASRLVSEGFRLICFGGGKPSGEELAMVQQFGIDATQFEWREGGDDMLRQIYREAALFVYPSLYEGFGIPPLEAMAHDCPVACSNTSSIPEVVGQAAELFDPSDVDSIREAMERVLYSPSRRTDLVRLGRERLGAFSWQRCALETRKVYQHLVA